jgi:hypothetical protein
LYRLLLSIIILLYTALAALYAVDTPKWQAPDEPAHFNYVRAIAETGAFPVLQRGDYDQAYLDKIKAAKFPASFSIDPIRYESYQPPLYYVLAAPVYLLARAGGLDAAVVALRLFGVAIGAMLLLVAYRIVRDAFPDDHFLALAVVGVIATVPQHIAISASISTDVAGELVLMLILWLAVRRMQNGLSDSRFAIWGGVLFGLVLLTKNTVYVPSALVLVGAEIARLRINNLQVALHPFRWPLVAWGLGFAIFLPWLIHGAVAYGAADPFGIARHDSIVTGQPTTAEMIARYGFNHIAFDYFAVTFKSFWAQFGWMGVLVNDRIYVGLMVLTGAALFGFGLYAYQVFHHHEMITEAQHWFLGIMAVILVVSFADFFAYNLKFFQLQGRYLFPAMFSIAVVLVLGLREILNRDYERIIFAGLYVGMLGLDAICLFAYIVPQLKP